MMRRKKRERNRRISNAFRQYAGMYSIRKTKELEFTEKTRKGALQSILKKRQRRTLLPLKNKKYKGKSQGENLKKKKKIQRLCKRKKNNSLKILENPKTTLLKLKSAYQKMRKNVKRIPALVILKMRKRKILRSNNKIPLKCATMKKKGKNCVKSKKSKMFQLTEKLMKI